MRGVVCAWCVVAGLSSCRAATTSDFGGRAVINAAAVGAKIPITSRSEQAIALFLLGRARNENLQPHEGYAYFQQAVALDPAFAMGEYALASTAPTAKQVREHADKAFALLHQVSDGERLLILAMRARLDADPVSVRQYAETLVTRYPRDERAHWVLGNACSAQQQYDKAIDHFQQAIALNPQYALAYNSVGYAQRSAGNTGAAELAFQRYIALVPNDPNPYDSYAELLMAMGRFDESIGQYRKALSIDPHFSGSFVGIAANHMFAGRYPEAIAEAERYVSVARDDHERRAALLTLALSHLDHGGTDDALGAMDRMYQVAHVIGDTASMSADLTAIADILLDAQRTDAAEDRYRQADALMATSSLTANVKQDGALLTSYNRARIARARHDTLTARAEAATFLRDAVSRGSSERVRQAHELNGLLALDARHFDRSLAALALADQETPSVRYAIAMAYAGKDDRRKAGEITESILHIYTLPTLPHVLVRARVRR